MASEWLFPTNTENSKESVEKSRIEELFVFGYACKLFRDDEQARAVDGGKYMIPWMGDEKLKIDRYDGRGHLFDLRPYDADLQKGLSEYEMSEDEKQLEQLCDEERYLELHTDLAEKTMYEEEEWKRYYESLADGYKAVGFSYDGSGQQQFTDQVSEEQVTNLDEDIFVPAVELQLPKGVEIPATNKENAIIEKTAKFIAEHGLQMEIVMKTKQANNPQFEFMHFENVLHQYYRHLVKMIKSKKYIPKSPMKLDTKDILNDNGGDNDHDDAGHGYLHPTLMTTKRASPTPEVYKPIPMPKILIHETSYGQLLQSFNKVNKEMDESQKLKEIKKDLKAEHENSLLPACVAQPAYTRSMPPPPGIEPVKLPKHEDENGIEVKVRMELDSSPSAKASRTPSPVTQIIPPPPDIQPIVDRMAMYVAKNGEEFAIVVKNKQDPRFQFLETWHTHYPYYNFKRHLFQEEMEREKKEQKEEAKKQECEKVETLAAKGVKFKLKKAAPKEPDTSNIDKKPVFADDDSGDENDSDTNKEKRSNLSMGTESMPATDDKEVAKNDEMLERKLAEQRLKDRIVASAREKLSQVDKEKQMKLERKKKAALFINLLKSQNVVDTTESNNNAASSLIVTPASNIRSSPVLADDTKSRHKSKQKSRNRRSRSLSRSRSSSRSKKKRHKRLPTPPSAYAVARKFPAPPPPPPRYIDMRTRLSRSPSRGQSSRQRSRSPTRSSRQKSLSRKSSKHKSSSKSKKKKKSRSPRSKKESGHRKSSKKKRKRSRSKERKASVSKSMAEDFQATIVSNQEDSRMLSPVGTKEIKADLEKQVTPVSSPEPGQIFDSVTEEEQSQLTPQTRDVDSDDSLPPARKRLKSASNSRSDSHTPILQKSHSGSSHYSSPFSIQGSKSRSATRSRSKSLSRSRSKSHSPVRFQLSSPEDTSESFLRSGVSSFPTSASLSREVTPVPFVGEVNGDEPEVKPKPPKENASSYMLDKIRAIIQASKDAVRNDQKDMFYDSS